MDSFVIRSSSGEGALKFFERTPADPSRPLERFKVRLSDQDLVATTRVYPGEAEPSARDTGRAGLTLVAARAHAPGASLASLFAQMAAHWRGWEGEFAWDAPDGELSLRATQDRAGHVAIRVAVRSGPGENNWAVRATIEAEAGQLDEIARAATRFFGALDGSDSVIPGSGSAASSPLAYPDGADLGR